MSALRTFYSIRDEHGREVWWTSGRAAAMKWAADFANGYAKGRGGIEAPCSVYLVSHRADFAPAGSATISTEEDADMAPRHKKTKPDDPPCQCKRCRAEISRLGGDLPFEMAEQRQMQKPDRKRRGMRRSA